MCRGFPTDDRSFKKRLSSTGYYTQGGGIPPQRFGNAFELRAGKLADDDEGQSRRRSRAHLHQSINAGEARRAAEQKILRCLVRSPERFEDRYAIQTVRISEERGLPIRTGK